MMIDAHAHVHCMANWVPDPQMMILNIFEYMDREHIERMLQEPQMYFGAGIHPMEVNDVKLDLAHSWIESYMSNDRFIAIGETGLEGSDKVEHHKQMEFLEMHVALCQKYKKPMVIHARNCNLMDILSVTKEVPTMLHCFTFGVPDLKIALEYNTMISFAGNVTYKSNITIQESAIYCPVDRMLVETDTPFLSPVPMRGKANEPSYIKYTYDFLSTLKSSPDLIHMVENNFKRFFSL